MKNIEIERHDAAEQILACDIGDDELEAAARIEEKAGSFTQIGCTSLPDCPG